MLAIAPGEHSSGHEDASDGMTYQGTVKSWNPLKGWGHLECQETFDSYGKDVFLLRKELGNVDPNSVQRGQVASFAIVDNGRGPEAVDVHFDTGFEQEQPQRQRHEAPKTGHRKVSGGAHGREWQPGCLEPCPSGTVYEGAAKSFNPEAGWGHITCPETEAMLGKDVFFMRSSLPAGTFTVERGQALRFELAEGLKGQEATRIVLGSGKIPGGSDFAGWGASSGGASRFVGGNRQRAHPYEPRRIPSRISPAAGGMVDQQRAPAPRMHQHQHQQQAADPGPVYHGSIKSWSDERGWGHIRCDQTHRLYGKDMFYLRSALDGAAEISENVQVQFNVVMGQKGHEAANIRLVDVQDAEHTVYEGAIKMWFEEKGWGFIACDATHEIFGKDIFLHKKDIGDIIPSASMPVLFTVQISAHGRPEAADIDFGAEVSDNSQDESPDEFAGQSDEVGNSSAYQACRTRGPKPSSRPARY